MLDDLKYIHNRDASDALGAAEKQYQQLDYEFVVSQGPVDVDNIVYAGMGGSALAATMCASWPGYALPFEVARGYDIPEYVSHRTYFIAASYSGNTKEVLSALAQAEARGAQIAVIAGGGMLAELARQKHYPLALLPGVGQPRYGVLSNLKALITLLQQAELLASKGLDEQLAQAANFMQTAAQDWLPTVPTARNRAKQVALDVIGKSVVVYAGPKLYPVAYKWKIGFNENAKHLAWANQYPEFTHNELLGWTEQPTDKPFAVIDLRSNFEHPQVQKQFVLSERLLSGRRPAPIVVQAEGDTLLEQLLFVVALGDFVTLYTALANGLNPSPVDIIEKFKHLLEE